ARLGSKHVRRQSARLIENDETAAPARTGRTEVIRLVLVQVFGSWGSAWIVKDGDRSTALLIVDVTTGTENDCPLSRSGVVSAQNEITRASVCHLRARHE